MLFQTSNLISEKKQSAELAERSLMAYRTINAQAEMRKYFQKAIVELKQITGEE